MKEADTTNQGSPDPADVAMTIWGERLAPRPKEAGGATPLEIWGPALQVAAETDEQDPVDPEPDLWGEGDGRRPRERHERRHGSARQGRVPIRLLLPAAWAAPPKRRSGWRQRFRRA